MTYFCKLIIGCSCISTVNNNVLFIVTIQRRRRRKKYQTDYKCIRDLYEIEINCLIISPKTKKTIAKQTNKKRQKKKQTPRTLANRLGLHLTLISCLAVSGYVVSLKPTLMFDGAFFAFSHSSLSFSS